MAPALLPENLKRLRKPEAIETVKHGRSATQMPAFGDKLNDGEIRTLVDYVYMPLPSIPVWGAMEIKRSQVVHRPEFVTGEASSVKPVYKADPLNLFLVVELGDHHVTVLDGDKLEPIHRFKSHFALHGGPKYSSDGRFVYFTSRDGWISKFDMYRLEIVAEVRAGINTRNAAVSSDDRFVIVGNYLPHNLVILDANDLGLIKIIPVKDSSGNSSRVSAVYDARPRGSFIVALKDIAEVWEIGYRGSSSDGRLAHTSGDNSEDTIIESFPIHRIKVGSYLDDFFFNQDYSLLIGASRDGVSEVVNLDTQSIVTDLELPGMPHLGSGITWKYKNTTVLATPNLKEAAVTVIDMNSWKTIKKIETLGSGFFMRSHEQSRYAWVDVFFGPDKDAVHVIDKATLEIIKTLRPAPGKTAAHVEFDRYGRYVLLSIWDMDGAVVVYDSKTLEEVKRIPMKKPSGKYNVYNKIYRSRGTSH